MRLSWRHAAALPFLALLAGCQPPAPELSAHDAYIQARIHSPLINHAGKCTFAKLPPFPLKVVKGRVFTVVNVDGVKTIGIIDTGAERSFVTPEIAGAAKLAASNLPAMQGEGVSGSFTSPVMIAHTFGFGSLLARGTIPIHVLAFGGSLDTRVGALIGEDLLDGRDWDMDLGHNLLVPYDVRNCVAFDPRWQTSFSGVPLMRGAGAGENKAQIALDTLLQVTRSATIPVTFDNGTVQAVLDTGATASIISRKGAHRIGFDISLTEKDPHKSVANISGKFVNLPLHSFAQMVVGEDLLRNVPILVVPWFDRRDSYDMILGMDYIGTHHLWLSYTTNAVYIDSGEKPASGGAAAATSATLAVAAPSPQTRPAAPPPGQTR